MNIAQVTLAAGAQTLQSLVQAQSKIMTDKVVRLIIQAPAGNSGTAYFGDGTIQPFELAAGDPFFDVPGLLDFGSIDMTEFGVKGTDGDVLNVWWSNDPRG